MRNIKLIIEYDGTSYHGWQSQNNAVAVQDVIEKALLKLTGEKCSIIGSGRTDAGVHALGQVANFVTNSNIPPEKFSYALNNILPDDIVIRNSEEVPLNFHARFSATGKKYRYVIYNSRQRSALHRNRAYFVPYPLDFHSMEKAIGYFVGTHDFTAFKAADSGVKTNVRTITGTWLKKDDEIITFEIAGNGFLYNMVRIIVGTLVEVGIGKLSADDIPYIIESRDRRKAGRTAPPHGLYLMEVYYPEKNEMTDDYARDLRII
ncbi:MAG TPA: tRNA pseudouridine(38-40) synthase TruA [Clostridiaceae bacterium]|nr:tRNA pseudouridine(38-40) synthase TruA [Clostridiaceae bacterium]